MDFERTFSSCCCIAYCSFHPFAIIDRQFFRAIFGYSAYRCVVAVQQLDALTIDTLPELESKLPVKSNSLVIVYIRRVLGSKDRPAHVQRLLADFEITADKDLAISKTLTKMGPMLGLMGTLIPMGPALVGLSTGDIASMAYNMQVAFATTVVGLFSSAIGFITQQVKQRWYLQDMTNLEFLSELLTEKRTA